MLKIKCIFYQGSSTSRIECLMILGGSDVIIVGITCTINVMPLYYPETIHLTPQSVEKKMCSMKLVPGAKKIGDHCYTIYIN